MEDSERKFDIQYQVNCLMTETIGFFQCETFTMYLNSNYELAQRLR